MSYQNLRKKTEGFTIIEVLIVLAIAGLIMLIVFLAIPQLRRNQQNGQMRNEASRVLSAATEFESNANGTQVSGSSIGSVFSSAIPDTTKAQLKSTTAFGTALTDSSTPGSSNIVVGTCGDGGSTPANRAAAVTGARTYALEYKLNGGQIACIQS